MIKINKMKKNLMKPNKYQKDTEKNIKKFIMKIRVKKKNQRNIKITKTTGTNPTPTPTATAKSNARNKII